MRRDVSSAALGNMRPVAEIEDVAGHERIAIRFPYDHAYIVRLKIMCAATFVPREHGGPHWAVALNITTLRRLREAIPRARTGPRLARWERRELRRERRLGRMAQAKTGRLRRLPIETPSLYEFIASTEPVRHYQLADIALMSRSNLINANDPGLGKTIETLGAIVESGLLRRGPHLVVAPKTILESPWVDEIERWLSLPTLWLSGDDTPKSRANVLTDAAHLHDRGIPFFLVTNPDMVRLRAEYERRNGRKVETAVTSANPTIHAIRWATATIDEFHKMGLSNSRTLGARGVYALMASRRWADSGTPIGGKPIRLWGGLHFTYPTRFSSLWRWAREWLDVKPNGFGHDIGGLLPEREDEFYRAHAPFMIRHTTAEVLPQLPKVRHVDVWCRMAPTQRNLYARYERDGELLIDGRRLAAKSILDQYARLKIMASAVCRFEGDALLPTANSCKLPALLERLDTDDGHAAIVGSGSKRIADLVYAWLAGKGIRVVLITGDIRGSDRASAVRAFQRGDSDVVVMTTTAGGVGITLDRADAVHILDETFDPDDQKQLIGRTRYKRPVVAYWYRTRDSVEEDIHEITAGKTVVNHVVLDAVREKIRARSR